MKVVMCLRGVVVVGLVGGLLAVAPAARADQQTSREQLHATLWMQRSAEYRELVAQTWRLATERLEAARAPGTAALEQQTMDAVKLASLPTAIVVDLDETVLDNSFYQARLLRDREGYQESSWRAWMLQASAPAVPGVAEFLGAAAAAGHRVFYLTNRTCSVIASETVECPEEAATQRNLSALGLPGAEDRDNLLLRGERPEWRGSEKGSRRAWIAARYRIILMAGDDLRDFVDRPLFAARRAELAPLFGTRWFLLPNAMYGSWERELADPACEAGMAQDECAARVLARKYALLDADPAPLELTPRGAWDPSAKRLRVASWNIEYLVEPATYAALAPACVSDGGRISGAERALPCGVVPRLDRTKADFAALRDYAARIDGDVIALQEVDGPRAAAHVFPGYQFCFSARPNVQKNGFAIRRGLPHRCEPEYLPLSLADTQRRGVVVTLFPGTDNEMTLLSVHLKSGCPAGPMNDAANPACAILSSQVEPLEQWIDAQARAGKRFGLLGDFNRRLILDGREARNASGQLVNLWPEIADGDPRGAALIDVTRGTRFVKCVDNDPFEHYIDTLLLGSDLAQRWQRSSKIRVPYSRTDFERYKLSDHCPVGAELSLH